MSLLRHDFARLWQQLSPRTRIWMLYFVVIVCFTVGKAVGGKRPPIFHVLLSMVTLFVSCVVLAVLLQGRCPKEQCLTDGKHAGNYCLPALPPPARCQRHRHLRITCFSHGNLLLPRSNPDRVGPHLHNCGPGWGHESTPPSLRDARRNTRSHKPWW